MEQKNKGDFSAAQTQTVVNSLSANVVNNVELDSHIGLRPSRDSKACLTNPLSILKSKLSAKSNIQIVNNEVFIVLSETPLTFKEIMRQFSISRRTTKCIINQLIIEGLCLSFHVAPRTPLLYTSNFRIIEFLTEGGSND